MFEGTVMVEILSKYLINSALSVDVLFDLLGSSRFCKLQLYSSKLVWCEFLTPAGQFFKLAAEIGLKWYEFRVYSFSTSENLFLLLFFLDIEDEKRSRLSQDQRKGRIILFLNFDIGIFFIVL